MSNYNYRVAAKANANKTHSSIILVGLTILVMLSMVMHNSYVFVTEGTLAGQEIQPQ